MVILNEVYFGESLITDRIVDTISQIMNTKIDLKSNKTKELLEELCDAIKDFCGARLVEIDMEEDTWGYTIAPPYKKRPEYKITKNGVRFKDNKEVVLIVTLNPKILFKDPKKKNLLTPRELTAVLLHEIGHNFSKSSLPLESVLETVKLALKIKNEAILNASKGKKIDINKKDLDNFINTTYTILGIGLDESKAIVSNAIDTARILGGAVISTLQPFMDRDRYADEQFADSFASIFGFGKDLSSALWIMEKEHRKRNNNGIFGLIMALFTVALYMLFDEHPDTVTRMHNQIETLEYELQNNKEISNEDKKMMRKQIMQIKTLVKQCTTLDTSNLYSIPLTLYAKTITDILGGQEIFGHITKALFNPKIMDYTIRHQ